MTRTGTCPGARRVGAVGWVHVGATGSVEVEHWSFDDLTGDVCAG
jgi:hypothetical protein